MKKSYLCLKSQGFAPALVTWDDENTLESFKARPFINDHEPANTIFFNGEISINKANGEVMFKEY